LAKGKAMLTITHFCKAYRGVEAVHDVSFCAKAGEVTGLLGENGAGKTSILKAVCALHCPTGGTVTVEGLDTAKDPLEVRRLVGYVAEQPAFYEGFTAAEHLLFFAKMHLSPLGWSAAECDAQCCAIAETCGLSDELLAKRCGDLSRGGQQRLALATALVHDPPVLVLDEPTAALDPAQAHHIRSLIAKAATEKTVLLSTHNLGEAEALCTQIHIIHAGRLVLGGTQEEIRRRTKAHTLEEAFLRATQD
jgi:ABC-2 type transport system ATP-binding protein